MKITNTMRMNIDMPTMFVDEPNLIPSSDDVGADVGACAYKFNNKKVQSQCDESAVKGVTALRRVLIKVHAHRRQPSRQLLSTSWLASVMPSAQGYRAPNSQQRKDVYTNGQSANHERSIR